MIDVSSAMIEKIIVHKVGNKIREEGYELSSHPAKLNEQINELFLRHYLLPLSTQKESYQFFHEADIELNAIQKYSSLLFNDNESFTLQTQNIAKHLYSTSSHPNISAGEVIIFLISDIRINEKAEQGLAILKIESKEEYLDITDNKDHFELVEKSGISLNKIQKGVLILSKEKKVFIIDNLSQKTKYWLDNFLKIIPQKTPEACAKLGSTILKSISNKISDVQESIALKNEIDKNLNLEKNISLKKIKEISEVYLEKQEVDKIIATAQDKVGFTLDDNLSIDSNILTKYTKNIVSRTKLKDGVNLVLTNPNLKIKNLEIYDTENGFQAVIDIHSKGA